MSNWTREYFGLLAEAELAALLGVKPLTLAKWRREGKGPAFLTPGKSVFYRDMDVCDWLKGIAQHPSIAPDRLQVLDEAA